jgi:L-ascorbate metabolism protein UlaG (beta-lactamase superfamily)
MAYLDQFESDAIETNAGELVITFLGHGTLMFAFDGKTIHLDPYGSVADYASLPPGDVVLITHEHGDHFDPTALALVRGPGTDVILTARCAPQVEGDIVMGNGDARTVKGMAIEAVPAYNVVHVRPNGQPFHPRHAGNGYIITFGDVRVYVAGDTENVPEMSNLRDIEVAFLPVNLPYTMTPEMAAAAALIVRPRVLYPYHYGTTDTQRLIDLLRDERDIEVRIRQLA